MKRLLVLVYILAEALLAEEPPKVLTKVEVTLHSADAPDGSFAATPKVFYRAGNGYCRIEEVADPENNLHNLMIVNEPDYWMVNLSEETRHAHSPRR